MALKNNTWTLNNWYAQSVAGNISYSGVASLFIWGKDTNGSLGQNSQVDYSSPVQIPGTTWQYMGHASSSTNDTDHAFAIKTDGTLWTWGSGGTGQLGQNNRTSYSSPIQIPGSNWGSYAEVVGQSSFAIKTDGTLWAWGKNDSGYGRLGLNNKTNYSSPAQIPGTTWHKIETYSICSMATRTDGTLWSWGYGGYGRLGLNANTNYSSPKQVPGTTWGTSMSGGGNSAGAVKTDGTLWMWGYNNYGQVGQDNTTAYSSPRQVPGTTWSKISCQTNSTIALKTDGTLWAWGYNDNGNLGLNNRTKYSSPVQIPGTTWSNLVSTSQSTIAVKTDNTMWSWGSNSYGELGVNSETKYSSPTQLAGTWNQGDRQIGSIGNGFMAIKDL